MRDATPARAALKKAPTCPLVRRLPVPIKKIIADLSNTERVLVGRDLRERIGT